MGCCTQRFASSHHPFRAQSPAIVVVSVSAFASCAPLSNFSSVLFSLTAQRSTALHSSPLALGLQLQHSDSDSDSSTSSDTVTAPYRSGARRATRTLCLCLCLSLSLSLLFAFSHFAFCLLAHVFHSKPQLRAHYQQLFITGCIYVSTQSYSYTLRAHISIVPLLIIPAKNALATRIHCFQFV